MAIAAIPIQRLMVLLLLLMLAFVLVAVDGAAVPPLASTSAELSRGEGASRTDAQRVIDAIPVADRAYFVTFHLAREAQQQGRNDVSVLPGFDRIPAEKLGGFKEVQVPGDFGRKLLHWVESEILTGRVVTKKEQQRLAVVDDVTSPFLWSDARFEVCFPQGCIDPNELGTNCCPF